MPSTKVKEVLYRVSTQLQDIAPQFTRWHERELVTWLNDGQRAIAKFLPASCTRIDALKLKPGTKQSIELIAPADVKPGDGSPAAAVYGNFLNDVVRNMGVDGLTAGRAVRVVSREVLDSQNPDWHTIVGTGRVDQFVFDPRSPKVFYVTPAIGAAPAVWIEVSYLANPVDIPSTGTVAAPLYGADSASATVISVDDKYVDDLANYILARAYMKDADFASSQPNAVAYSSMFTSSLNAQVQALTGNNPNLTALPFAAQSQTPAAVR
ncbi:phage adaptor protein [Janthinobacterium sp. CG3]|uniref:phage adaptor protein n=1 Tax=Janthinobacterium sp. CG3 TaxID=1075768 RepID=UPI00034D4B14|nr:DUF6682 family protein [Janthinobacterium sp. CG3]